ncbi:hypothetical protein HN51_062317 [Arachis hypogaea]|uniref:uncharacterized protein DDB_G0280205-like n=1 Tax=Arachis ipaensis TaxID=130454 RepID=UPI0007AF0F6D|nr:uncharacterized protein DDB_G0280205-like [Arachis ipaensis]XP_025627651.1 uncharacterized protein DDB_G0280205 [Arachis hypogaea]
MACANAIHTKHQKLAPEKNQDDPNKFYYHFLYKAALVAIFFVILPMFPSQAPDFINQSLVTRNWELLHILFVGIAISYGLFSRKNDEKVEKENNGTKFDNAQTLVSRFLQVSSFFEDEAEITPSSSSSSSSDESTTTTTSSNKVQTWNNQHYRKEPVVVVANQQQPAQYHSNFENKGGGGGGGSGGFASGEGSRIIGEKPLLLPVRSLKSRLCDDPHVDYADEIAKPVNGTTTSSVCLNRSNSNSNKTIVSKRFSPSNSMKTRNGELEGPGSPRIVENTKDSNVVLPSPIPWRSRSGKEIETPTAQYPSSMEESEFNKVESRSVMRSQTYSRSSRTSPVSSAESVAKNSEKVMRKVVFCKSCPPPPPPPPPMFQKSVSMKPSRYGSSFSGSGSSFDKELKRSFTSEGRRTFIADNNINNKNKIKNMGSFSKSKEVKEQFDYQEPRRKSNKTGMGYENKMSFRTDKFMPEAKAPTTELAEEEEEEKEESFLDKGMMENDHYDDEDDDDDESSEYEDEDVARKARMMQKEKVENLPPHVEEASKTEEEEEEESAAPSSDVDKKADEFIAKFREQIRLQRIESIKRSTRTTRKSSR